MLKDDSLGVIPGRPNGGGCLPINSTKINGSLIRSSGCHSQNLTLSASGPGCVKTKSDLVVMPSEGRIFAFFCSERDHKPQNSGCGYTTQSFHTAWFICCHHALSQLAAAYPQITAVPGGCC